MAAHKELCHPTLHYRIFLEHIERLLRVRIQHRSGAVVPLAEHGTCPLSPEVERVPDITTLTVSSGQSLQSWRVARRQLQVESRPAANTSLAIPRKPPRAHCVQSGTLAPFSAQRPQAIRLPGMRQRSSGPPWPDWSLPPPPPPDTPPPPPQSSLAIELSAAGSVPARRVGYVPKFPLWAAMCPAPSRPSYRKHQITPLVISAQNRPTPTHQERRVTLRETTWKPCYTPQLCGYIIYSAVGEIVLPFRWRQCSCETHFGETPGHNPARLSRCGGAFTLTETAVADGGYWPLTIPRYDRELSSNWVPSVPSRADVRASSGGRTRGRIRRRSVSNALTCQSHGKCHRSIGRLSRVPRCQHWSYSDAQAVCRRRRCEENRPRPAPADGGWRRQLRRPWRLRRSCGGAVWGSCHTAAMAAPRGAWKISPQQLGSTRGQPGSNAIAGMEVVERQAPGCGCRPCIKRAATRPGQIPFRRSSTMSPSHSFNTASKTMGEYEMAGWWWPHRDNVFVGDALRGNRNEGDRFIARGEWEIWYRGETSFWNENR